MIENQLLEIQSTLKDAPLGQKTADFITSGPAKVIFLLSIIGVGYGTLALGRLDKNRAVSIVTGIGLIYSAGYLAQHFGMGN